MDKSASRLLIVSIAVYLLGFLYFLGFSTFELADVDVLPSLQPAWLVRNAAVHTLSHAITLQLFAILLCFSLFVRARDMRSGGSINFYSLIRASLVLLMLLTAAYSIGSLVFEPQLRQSRRAVETQSSMARLYRSRGVEAFEQGRYETAVRDLRRYLRIAGPDMETQELLDSARSEQAMAGPNESPEGEEFRSATDAGNFTTGELIERAQRFFEEEDYFSAHYYANLALERSAGLEAAQRLVTRARQHIAAIDLSAREREEQRLYRRKREGYNALYTRNNPIEAYNIFLQLREEAPRDPDVQRYFHEAVAKVREISFFVEEIEEIAGPPSASDVMTVDRGEDGVRQFVHIESLYRVASGSYAERVEVMALTPEWEVAYHFRAPYAKFLDSHLALRAIRRDNPQDQVTPTYFEDQRPEELRHVLRLDIAPFELVQTGTNVENAGLLTLWRMTDLFPRVGFPSEPVYVELGMRLILPFSFLVLSVLGTAMAWRWRSRYIARPPLPALLLLPVLPFVLNYFTVLFVFGQRVVATFLLVTLGVATGFALLLAVQAALVIVALTLLATQAHD